MTVQLWKDTRSYIQLLNTTIHKSKIVHMTPRYYYLFCIMFFKFISMKPFVHDECWQYTYFDIPLFIWSNILFLVIYELKMNIRSNYLIEFPFCPVGLSLVFIIIGNSVLLAFWESCADAHKFSLPSSLTRFDKKG